ncbi:MAG TPA: hypothetical protein VLF63_00235, partial [Patescibacteria group bacterium]|nr:hypothetical protein [Patescibacteria group bacterium]
MPLTKIYKHKNFKNVTLLIFIAVFILIGIILFTSSRATGPFVSVNSDQGNVKTPASIQSSSQVNDGKYVLFGSGASGNGSITFDGTFSTNDPASGPHWNNAYGSCYQFTAANQLTMTPNSS